MEQLAPAPGAAEIAAAIAGRRGLLAAVVAFSAFVNILMMTGSIFMLQVYDRVLASRSIETLAALSLVAVFLYLVLGLLDQARARVMVRAAAQVQAQLDRRVFSATLAGSGSASAALALRDLEALQRALASPGLLALMDVPWVPLFLGLIFLFHPLMGWLALAGGGVLIAASALQQHLTRDAATRAFAAQHSAERSAEQFRNAAEELRALGMQDRACERWQSARSEAMRQGIAAADAGTGINAFSRTFRLFLQSAMLALGAVLTLRGYLSGGAMVSSSVLLGRALAPIEGLIAGWPLLARALAGRRRLAGFLADVPPARPRLVLPHPVGRIAATGLSIAPPGSDRPVLRIPSLTITQGQIVGVVGPSGAGKSTLLRALCGAWAPLAGEIRLDGAMLAQYDPAILGAAIGYVPQRVGLFQGTIGENIARLAARPDPATVIRAARASGSHDMILSLPDGYDTRIDAHHTPLSGGQVQRIGLARAMFGDPPLWLLDEPDANLDAEGTLALGAAVRAHKARGGTAVLTAHRQTLLHDCDIILALDRGTVRALGPRADIWPNLFRRPAAIAGDFPLAREGAA